MGKNPLPPELQTRPQMGLQMEIQIRLGLPLEIQMDLPVLRWLEIQMGLQMDLSVLRSLEIQIRLGLPLEIQIRDQDSVLRWLEIQMRLGLPLEIQVGLEERQEDQEVPQGLLQTWQALRPPPQEAQEKGLQERLQEVRWQMLQMEERLQADPPSC